MIFKVVLVRPIYPRNIGLVARAMENFGAQNLILIDPAADMESVELREGASQAQATLKKAEIYPHWDRFYEREPEGLRLAFSRRQGRRRPAEPFSGWVKEQTLKSHLDRPVYLIFGPEDDGLSDSDLDFVHRIVYLETPGPNKSLNLSHAVMSTLTMIHSHQMDLEQQEGHAEEESFYFPEKTLKKWLEALNMDITTRQRVNAYTILKRLLLQGVPTPKELRVLEMALQQTIRRLKPKEDKDLES